MFVNEDFSDWAYGQSLKSLQEASLNEGRPSLSVYESIRDYGFEVADYHVKNAQKRLRTFSEIYDFDDLPRVWPISVIKLLYTQLPRSWAQQMESVKFGMICSNDINAMAWPPVGNVGIVNGLPDYVLSCCYATAPFELLSPDINPKARRLGHNTREASAKYVVSVSPQEKLLAYAESIDSRSRLSSEFPQERSLIEQPAVAMANDMIRFITMHELSHIVLGHEETSGLQSQIQESEADQLAIETLCQISGDISPFAGALAMSLLEAHGRLGGMRLADSSEAGPDDSHPSNDQRRCDILEIIAREFSRLRPPDDVSAILLSMAHIMHIELSSLLYRNGYDPLAPFFSAFTLRGFGAASVPDYIATAPDKVAAIERIPFKTAGVI